MAKILSRFFRSILNGFGYEIVKTKYVNSFELGNWINNLDIKTIIDVGSNEGQFIKAIDNSLPGRNFLAFEPIKSCYDELLKNTKKLNVTAFNCGLSDHSGSAEINISGNFVSSSILPMENLHKDLYPESYYVNKQVIDLKRLDDVTANLNIENNILMKIDVQGYEEKVIAGGENTIKKCVAIIIEYSHQPLYEGQWLFDDTFRYFTSNGF
ncbi:MAG: FkbM family methyltransferase, partial [Bacteroidetes bacterium]|nr:FkbM family methyltransferase [Bacteroidota bacterium]